ncbi:C2HC-type_zinc-finger domain-containing protein [Hexamita inflata]|uniref:C2HC-type zinc-finger domain-containing protein n=1 Tax=Hexamita inflata TaxID=28002 RepID=A0AA86N6D2_9EUKA|nr:C2HC-type zinc-finger domain-containing protein [Hexamita inflata]
MADQKPFYLVVQLVKSQIYSEKLLRKVQIADAVPSLSLLMDKYPWIKTPAPHAQLGEQTLAPRVQKPKYKIIDEDTQPLPQKQQQKPQPTQKPSTQIKPKQTQPEPEENLKTSKFNPKEQPETVEEGDNRVPCQFCARKFQPDRVGTHEKICAENPAKAKKRPAMIQKVELASGEAPVNKQKKVVGQ